MTDSIIASESQYPMTILETYWAMALLDAVVKGSLKIEEIRGIVSDKSALLRTLIDTKANSVYIGGETVEYAFRSVALKIVQEINDLHNERDAVRFKSVDNMSPQELYTLMVYGEEEVFTSTFNGFFNRFLNGLDKDKTRGDELLSQVGYNKFRTFIKECAGFGRLADFLATMDAAAQKEILKKFVENIDKEHDMLAVAVTVADTFSMIENPEVLNVLQTTIQKEYERTKKEGAKEAIALYGLLASMFENKAVIDKAWFAEMAEKYKIPNFSETKSEALFDKNGVNTQRYFFYDDRSDNENRPDRWDGHNSFKNFLGQYGFSVEWNKEGELLPIKEHVSKTGWRIEDNGSFVTISQENKASGKKIFMYANKPDVQNEGLKAIDAFLKEHAISVTVVVHRGHSYHFGDTVEKIRDSAVIVYAGSCGGYHNLQIVFDQAKNVYYISTKGTGTMLVNDLVLFLMNKAIVSGKDINWRIFKETAEKAAGKNSAFSQYVFPHENLGMFVLQAYSKLIEEEK